MLLRLLSALLPVLAAVCLGAAPAPADPLPANLADALEAFRSDGPKGWTYKQTTVAGKESLEETFDPARPESDRWALVAKDGRVFRELKPTRVNDKLYYNLVLGGVLRRVSRVTLEKEASNVQ